MKVLLMLSIAERVEAYFEKNGSFAWVEIAAVVIMNIVVCWLMIVEMKKIKKEGDFSNSDKDKVAEIFNEVRQHFWFYPLLSILCLSPAGLILSPFFISFMKKKEKIFRDTPRNCEYCGAPMRKLAYWEEEEVMTENQRFEERKIRVAEYDFWVCESCGNKTVMTFKTKKSEKYAVCPACQCLAGKTERDEVLVKATRDSVGRGLHHNVCQKCGHQFTVEYKIPLVSDND